MSNQEKVARALLVKRVTQELLFDEQADLSRPVSAEEIWTTPAARPFQDAYRSLAAAAIDALADVDGIAGVLDAHEDSTGSMNECSCGRWGSFDVNWHVRLKSFNQHQAAAVVAWMKDQT